MVGGSITFAPTTEMLLTNTVTSLVYLVLALTHVVTGTAALPSTSNSLTAETITTHAK